MGQVVLFDMKNWAMWHANYMSYISHLTDIAQNHYPERLKKIFLVNTPGIFRATWALIKLMLAQKTIDKAPPHGVVKPESNPHFHTLDRVCLG